MDIQQAVIISLEKAMKETLDQKIGSAIDDYEFNVGSIQNVLVQALQAGAKSAIKEIVEEQIDFSQLITKDLITNAVASAIKEIVQEKVDVSLLITDNVVRGAR